MIEQYMLLKDNGGCWPKSTSVSHPWTDINILRFLSFYQSYRILWDITNPLYNHKKSRCSAYRQIAKSLKLQNVDEKECMKLVEILRKRYIEERSFNEGKNKEHPAWFKIISNIIKKILNSQNKKKDSSTDSFAACQECCTAQNLAPPCCRYENSEKSSTNYEDCCIAQNLNPPCNRYEESIESEFKMEKNEAKCYTLIKDDLQMLLVSFKKDGNKFEDSENYDQDMISECQSSSTGSRSTDFGTCSMCDDDDDDDDDDDNCDCTSFSSQSSSSSKSIEDYEDQRTHDCELSKSQSSSSTASQSDDEKQYYNDVKSSFGLFTDSSRFHGKPISLANEYYEFDNFDGSKRIGIIKARKHFARFIKQNHFYPLQLDF